MSDLRKIIEDSVAILENSRIQTTDIFHVERTITKLKEALEQPQSKCSVGLMLVMVANTVTANFTLKHWKNVLLI